MANIQSFKIEVDIAKKLNHPNIVKIFEMWEDSKFFFIVMEYCEGGELLDYIADNYRLSERDSAFFMR